MEQSMENNISEVKTSAPEPQKGGQGGQIAGAIVLAGLFIAGAILLKGSIPPPQPEGLAANPSNFIATEPAPVSTADYVLGSPEAKIFIIEYSDTECPFCKRFHVTMNTIMDETDGEVAWVYRHFPITERHPKAAYQAEALECAGELGGNDIFWKYTDRLYTLTNSNNSFPDEGLPEIAREVGLDVAKFNQCLESGKYKSKILSQLEDGQKAGVQGTPHSFIVKNGKVVDIIPGAQPIEVVRQKIKEALR